MCNYPHWGWPHRGVTPKGDRGKDYYTKTTTSVMISNLKQSLRDKQCIFLHYSYPQVVLVHGDVRRLSREEHYDSKLTTHNMVAG